MDLWVTNNLHSINSGPLNLKTEFTLTEKKIISCMI